MNDFDRHIGLLKAFTRLQPNHKKIYAVFSDITSTDVYILMTIYHCISGWEYQHFSDVKPVSVSELRKRVHGGILPTAISRSLKNLESVGYIKRTADTNDARKKYVELTEQGYESVKKFELLMKNYWNRVYSEYGTERAKHLTDEINALADVLEKQEIDSVIKITNDDKKQ